MTSIRRATVDDVEAMLEISNWAVRHTPANFAYEPEAIEDWRKSFETTNERYPWIVATAPDGSGRVVGFAKAGPWKARAAYAWTCELSVYIEEKFHGRGLGKRLYAKLFPTLEAQGYRTLFAGVTMSNPASVRLHESMGMRLAGPMSRSGWKFGAWHDVGYWQMSFGEGPPGEIRPVSAVWRP